MAFDLPFLSDAQRKATNLRTRTEEELDPWGATTVPRAPRVWEPDIPTTLALPAAPPPLPVSPVPTPTPQPATRPRDTVMASDEAAFRERVQADPVYDPLNIAALKAGGFVETQAEMTQRENVEREIHQFEQRLNRDSNFAELTIHNMEREAAGLDPRPVDGLEAIAQYDKEVLDPLAYAVVYGAQKLSPGMVWQGYSKGEGYEFEKRVDEIRRNSPSYEEARALGLPITSTVEGALRQAAEEELLPWYVTEPIKLIADPANWPVGGVPLIRGAAKFPFVVGSGVVKLKNAGSAVGRNVPLRYAGVAQAAGDPARATQRSLIDANRAFFDVPEFDYTLTGNGRIEIVYPESTVIRANSSAEELFRITPLEGGLSGRQRLMSAFKESGVGKLMRKGLGGLDWIMTPENHYVTPAMEARNVGLRNLKSISTAWSRTVSGIANHAFDINPRTGEIRDIGLLQARADIDTTLKGVAPTIQDIAARLPYYWDSMTTSQREAMEELRSIFGRLKEAYDDSGYPKEVGNRQDVVSEVLPELQVEGIPVVDISEAARGVQGFYIPRGTARTVRETVLGMEIPRPKIPIGRSQFEGAPDFTKAEEFPSMSEAMEGIVDANDVVSRYRYNSLRNATRDYVEEVGKSVWDMHVSNYLKNLINPATGEAFAIANTTRIPRQLRNRWNALKRNLATARESQRRIMNQMVPMNAEVRRLGVAADRQARISGRRVGEAATRTEKARLQQVLAQSEITPIREEMHDLQVGMRYISEHLGGLINEIKADRALLSATRKLTRAADRAMNKAILDAERALDEAETYMTRGAIAQRSSDTVSGLPGGSDPLLQMGTPNASWEDWFGMMERVEALRTHADDLAIRSDALHVEVDNLLAKGSMNSDAANEARDLGVQIRREVRALSSRDREIAFAQHDYKMLKVEQGRLERWAAKDIDAANKAVSAAEGRVVKADAALASNKVKIQNLDDLITGMSDEWHNAVGKARGTAATGDIIPLPGLGGYYFPDAVANAARVFLKEPGMAKLLGSGLDAFNSLYRGARGTLDNSYFLIQMLLRHYDDPRGMYNAWRLSFQAWGVPVGRGGTGETVIDSFFRSFDEGAKNKGHLASNEWARHGLVITGADTEFALGAGALSGIGRLPMIRNANRAFGALGDWARLNWADDMLEGMLKNKTMDELVRSGDLEDIAQMINGATGWAPGRFGGSLGDLALFAPRFLQSRFNTVARAVGGIPSVATKPLGSYGWQGVYGSVGQRQATKSMFKMISIGTMLTMGINEAMGRETDLRPLKKDARGEWIRNTNFMRINVAGKDISLFGTWDSLVGLMLTAGTEGPHNAMRTMASGATRNVWDFATGATAMGERTRDTSSQITMHILENFIPFGGDDLKGNSERIYQYAASRDVGHTAAAAAVMFGDLHGLKSSPLSLSEERTELRLNRGRELVSLGILDVDNAGRVITDEESDNIKDALDSDPWAFKSSDLPAWALGIIDSHPVIEDKTIEMEEQRRERGSEYQVMVDAMDTARDKFFGNLDNAMMAVGQNADGSQRKSGSLKTLLKEATRDYAREVQHIQEEDHKELIARLDKMNQEEQATTVFNLVRDEIFTKLYDPDLTDALGRFDFDEYERVENEIRTDPRWADYTDVSGKSIVDSVFAKIRENEHPLQTMWREARETLKPWFEAPDVVADAFLAMPNWTELEKRILRDYTSPKAEPKQRFDAEIAARIANPEQNGVRQDIIAAYTKGVDAYRTILRDDSPAGLYPEQARAINEEITAWDFQQVSLSKGRIGSLQGYLQNTDPTILQGYFKELGLVGATP